MASTDTQNKTENKTTKPRAPRKPKAPTGAPERPTVTLREYQGTILPNRLAAMHAYENGEIDLATRNLARRAVRQARTIMKAEAGKVEAFEEFEKAEDERKAAEAENKPARKPRTRAAKKEIEQVPGSPLTEVEAPELKVTETEDGGVKVEVAA